MLIIMLPLRENIFNITSTRMSPKNACYNKIGESYTVA